MEKKMMMMMMGLSLLAFIVDLTSTCGNGVDTCQEAIVSMTPCKPYLNIGGPAIPAPPCCEGVKKVASQATTPVIRKELCECFKKAAAVLSIDGEKLKKLPDLCHVKAPVPLDPSDLNCTKVQTY